MKIVWEMLHLFRLPFGMFSIALWHNAKYGKLLARVVLAIFCCCTAIFSWFYVRMISNQNFPSPLAYIKTGFIYSTISGLLPKNSIKNGHENPNSLKYQNMFIKQLADSHTFASFLVWEKYLLLSSFLHCNCLCKGLTIYPNINLLVSKASFFSFFQFFSVFFPKIFDQNYKLSK